MNNDETARMKKEINDLKLEVARLSHIMKMEAGSTTKHIKELYRGTKLLDDYIGRIDKRDTKDIKFLCQHIADLHDIVSPIEDKIFPRAKDTRRQMKTIVGPRRLGVGKDLDKRKGD